MLTLFKSFRSTVNPFWSRDWFSPIKVLVDKDSGAPCGIQSPNANGPDGIWTPIDITAAQAASPTAEMITDLNATYRLNVAPYTRYHSDGTQLQAFGSDTTPISAADVANPSAALLADTSATYQLNVSPYTRYYSNGTTLVAGGVVTISAATAAAPTAAILADIYSTYQLDSLPYTRFRSDGNALLALDGSNYVPASGWYNNTAVISSFHVKDPIGVHVRGTLHVRA